MRDVSATSVSLVAVPGLAWANHDICPWSFVPEPTALLLVCGAAAALFRREEQRAGRRDRE